VFRRSVPSPRYRWTDHVEFSRREGLQSLTDYISEARLSTGSAPSGQLARHRLDAFDAEAVTIRTQVEGQTVSMRFSSGGRRKHPIIDQIAGEVALELGIQHSYDETDGWHCFSWTLSA